jgi:hypothetical protein
MRGRNVGWKSFWDSNPEWQSLKLTLHELWKYLSGLHKKSAGRACICILYLGICFTVEGNSTVKTLVRVAEKIAPTHYKSQSWHFYNPISCCSD